MYILAYSFQCVLAAIITVALRSLILQILDLPKIWKTSVYDCVSISIEKSAYPKFYPTVNHLHFGGFSGLRQRLLKH